jgi:hypothetical protein
MNSDKLRFHCTIKRGEKQPYFCNGKKKKGGKNKNISLIQKKKKKKKKKKIILLPNLYSNYSHTQQNLDSYKAISISMIK